MNNKNCLSYYINDDIRFKSDRIRVVNSSLDTIDKVRLETIIRFINLSYNRIESIKNLQYFNQLRNLDLSFNKIKNLSNLYYLKNNTHLTSVNLLNNPIVNNKYYKSILIYLLPNIKTINKEFVDINNKNNLECQFIFETLDLIYENYKKLICLQSLIKKVKIKFELNKKFKIKKSSDIDKAYQVSYDCFNSIDNEEVSFTIKVQILEDIEELINDFENESNFEIKWTKASTKYHNLLIEKFSLIQDNLITLNNSMKIENKKENVLSKYSEIKNNTKFNNSKFNNSSYNVKEINNIHFKNCCQSSLNINIIFKNCKNKFEKINLLKKLFSENNKKFKNYEREFYNFNNKNIKIINELKKILYNLEIVKNNNKDLKIQLNKDKKSHEELIHENEFLKNYEKNKIEITKEINNLNKKINIKNQEEEFYYKMLKFRESKLKYKSFKALKSFRNKFFNVKLLIDIYNKKLKSIFFENIKENNINDKYLKLKYSKKILIFINLIKKRKEFKKKIEYKIKTKYFKIIKNLNFNEKYNKIIIKKYLKKILKANIIIKYKRKIKLKYNKKIEKNLISKANNIKYLFLYNLLKFKNITKEKEKLILNNNRFKLKKIAFKGLLLNFKRNITAYNIIEDKKNKNNIILIKGIFNYLKMKINKKSRNYNHKINNKFKRKCFIALYDNYIKKRINNLKFNKIQRKNNNNLKKIIFNKMIIKSNLLVGIKDFNIYFKLLQLKNSFNKINTFKRQNLEEETQKLKILNFCKSEENSQSIINFKTENKTSNFKINTMENEIMLKTSDIEESIMISREPWNDLNLRKISYVNNFKLKKIKKKFFSALLKLLILKKSSLIGENSVNIEIEKKNYLKMENLKINYMKEIEITKTEIKDINKEIEKEKKYIKVETKINEKITNETIYMEKSIKNKEKELGFINRKLELNNKNLENEIAKIRLKLSNIDEEIINREDDKEAIETEKINKKVIKAIDIDLDNNKKINMNFNKNEYNVNNKDNWVKTLIKEIVSLESLERNLKLQVNSYEVDKKEKNQTQFKTVNVTNFNRSVYFYMNNENNINDGNINI